MIARLRGWFEVLRAIVRGRAQDRELAEEIDFHLERQTAKHRVAGMSEDEAARAAKLDFGRVGRVREEHRDARGARWLMDFLGDLRIGVRLLIRQPGITVTALLALALGVGGNTAMFSVLDGVIMKPLPYGQPDGVVVLWQTNNRGVKQATAAFDVVYWREHSQAFEQIAALRRPMGASLVTSEGPEHVVASHVSGNFFELLRVDAAHGRIFTAAEDAEGAQPVVVLSHRYWTSRFGADPEVVGTEVSINGAPTVIVGVMPGQFRFEFLGEADIWIPLVLTQAQLDQRNFWSERPIGRLAAGVSVQQANDDLTRVTEQLLAEHPTNFFSEGPNVVPLHEEIVGDVKPTLTLLAAAMGLVLLVACVNVANLLLARNASRNRELTLRVAIGASRGRIARQLFAEAAALGSAGALLAVGFGFLLVRGLRLVAVDRLPMLAAVTMDLRVIAYTGALALATVLLFGLAPAWYCARRQATGRVAATTGGAGSRGERRALSSLVGVETALVLVLLVSAGLVLRTYANLSNVDAGFPTASRLAVEIVLPSSSYPTAGDIATFFAQTIEEIERVPGVSSAAATSSLPLSGRGITIRAPAAEGEDPPDPPIAMGWDAVSPGYFDAIGMRILAGRGITDADDASTEPIWIINETLARQQFGERDPIGLFYANTQGNRWRIAGIVSDVAHHGLDVAPRPAMYQPQAQAGFPWPTVEVVVVASTPDPLALTPALRSAVRRVDPLQPIARVRTLDTVRSGSLAEERLRALLFTAFGCTALLLGAIGIHGVVAYGVSQRTREIGVRRALGARAVDIRRLVLRAGLGPVVAGCAVGAAVALFSGQLLSGLLYGVAPNDPVVLAGVAVIIVGVAGVAVTGPMLRALRVDPARTLKRE